ncbi:hypothetical protein [Pseudonocardia sp. GCM10023141]|uniref:hypothetical protein n=1 Tax=Pseudonocardia sp. GCM10023141 TaxID=3252653 RepID=UPI0036192DA5
MPTCALCPAERTPDDPSSLAWVREQEPGREVRWICPQCARRHVRDIEGKLAPEWWGPNA